MRLFRLRKHRHLFLAACVGFKRKQPGLRPGSCSEIKRSLGITRGKSDKVDAKEIAHYAKRNTDKIALSTLPELSLQQLKIVFAEREKTVAAIKTFERTKENEMFLTKEVFNSVKAINNQTVKHLKNNL
ncbi:MAG: hypothetical protein IPP34_19250 [Bacteroidetes bacterium]|nr:hypothetical protein [Bacteroidota bacterium]